jgi:hypothetical protein
MVFILVFICLLWIGVFLLFALFNKVDVDGEVCE